jgi:hypothetical protein
MFLKMRSQENSEMYMEEKWLKLLPKNTHLRLQINQTILLRCGLTRLH